MRLSKELCLKTCGVKLFYGYINIFRNSYRVGPIKQHKNVTVPSFPKQRESHKKEPSDSVPSAVAGYSGLLKFAVCCRIKSQILAGVPPSSRILERCKSECEKHHITYSTWQFPIYISFPSCIQCVICSYNDLAVCMHQSFGHFIS